MKYQLLFECDQPISSQDFHEACRHLFSGIDKIGTTYVARMEFGRAYLTLIDARSVEGLREELWRPPVTTLRDIYDACGSLSGCPSCGSRDDPRTHVCLSDIL